jgi:putative flavoprotein involved in K+ transport
MTMQKIENTGEQFDTVVIGGGQAGLAVGYCLMQRGERFAILDANDRTGASWRKRWKSLKLFTPGKFNSLPGLPFPGPADSFPTKDQTAEYLEEYVRRFHLPVRHGIIVDALEREGDLFIIRSGSAWFAARNVVVATGPFQVPTLPPSAGELDPSILQIHSSAYVDPDRFPAKSVLVVGAGNSGAEIALELAASGRQVWLAGRDVGRIPANGPLGRFLGGRPVWWAMNHVLTVNTPIGRKIKAKEGHHGTPLGRLTRQALAESGISLAPRLAGVRSGRPLLQDGRLLSVDGVIWATGFRPDYGWIKLPIFDQHGEPKHQRGVVREYPGLYFVGLMFQTALSSSLLGGVGRDAAYIADRIRLPVRQPEFAQARTVAE